MLSTRLSQASAAASSVPPIVDFYERRVLPVLFDRLDATFPEFQWQRTPNGWIGRIIGDGNGTDWSDARRVHCHQPWGFVDATGKTISWLAYVSGGTLPTGDALISAVRKLAGRIGVDDSALRDSWTSEEQSKAHAYERQRALLEAFVAYCHSRLCSAEGHRGLEYLQRAHGINGHEANDLPLGIFTSQQDVHHYLRSVGFSDAEITASKVARDVRLNGRITIPWRDRWGNIRTVVAFASSGTIDGRPRQLYRKCDATDDAFGLDFALRATSGGLDDLILVEGLLDVVYFQTHGLTNVATFGAIGKVPTVRQWERLADHGIRRVTLALADDHAGWDRTLSALGNSYQADRSPQVFALPLRSLETARGAATCARLRGMGHLRHVISQRLHGFHFVARALINEYQDGADWTDAGLVDLLNDAVEFDARVYTPQRTLELERFFWPPILTALGANWENVRRLLRRPLDHPTPVIANAIAEHQPARQVIPAPPPPARAPAVVRRLTMPARPVRPRIVPQEIVRPETGKFTPRPQPPAPEPDPIPVDLRKLAYEIWERKGRPQGCEKECWLEAVEIVRQRQARGERIYAKSA